MDDAFDSTEEAVECAVTDKDCNEKQKVEKAKKSKKTQKAEKSQKTEQSPVVQTGSQSTPMKCVMTDVACLQEAKSLGKQVEIVDEADLNVVRCRITDMKCLKKAKKLGKQVEIID